MQTDIAIIGTGLAGYNLAQQIRHLNKELKLTLITKDDGTFYSKPLLSTGFSQHKSKDELTIFDAEAMEKRLDATILRHTTVKDIQPSKNNLTSSQGDIQYKNCVIAQGALTKNIPFKIQSSKNVFRVNSLDEYLKFKSALEKAEHIAIIGAGLVGCEFANDIIKLGKKISLISLEAYPIAHILPKVSGDILKEALIQNGIDTYFDVKVEKITDEIPNIHLNNNTNIKADIVLIAIGITPNISLAEKCGLKVKNGIVVNQYLQSLIKNIYAMGDCMECNNQVYQYVMPIMTQAKTLAKTLTGTRTAIKYPVMPIIAKTPACPIRVVLPPKNTKIHTQIQQFSDINSEVHFLDNKEEFVGYALTGEYIKLGNNLSTVIKK